MAIKAKSYPQFILDLLAKKTAILSKAQALTSMEMLETAQPLWLAAASSEERLAPLLESLGREREAAVHRISAASCYRNAGEMNQAVNLYRAALGGPIRDVTRRDVEKMLADCLNVIKRTTRARSRKTPVRS